MDETAAWHELEAAVDAALWRYAEAVTGQPRALAAGGPGVAGPFGARDLQLARLGLLADDPAITAASAPGAVSALRSGPAAEALQFGQDV